MTFDSPLVRGALLRRWKRFFVDVELPDGSVVTAHCPNTGSMLDCSNPGSPVFLSASDDPRRRLRWTLELVRAGDALIGVHTGRANRIVEEAIRRRRIPELSGWTRWRREAPFEDSRFDFRLEDDQGLQFVEVKNVTHTVHGVALFPDAVTVRGRKHLRTLVRAVRAGHRGLTVFLVQRADATAFRPADAIDREYGVALRQAARRGVEIIAWRARPTPRGIVLDSRLPVQL